MSMNIPTGLISLDCLTEISDLCSKLTNQQIERAGRSLNPATDKEKALGTIHNDLLKRLWTVALILASKSKQRTLELPVTDEEADSFKSDSERMGSLSVIAAKLFWHELNLEMNAFPTNLGIRRGWLAVEPESDSDPLKAALSRLFES